MAQNNEVVIEGKVNEDHEDKDNEEKEKEEEIEVEEEVEEENEQPKEEIIEIKQDNNEENENENEEQNNENEEQNNENEEQKNEESPEEEEEIQKKSKSGRVELKEDENSQNEEENEEDDNQNNQHILRMQEGKSTEKYKLDETEVSSIYFENNENMVIIFQKDISSPNLVLHWGVYKDYPINKWFQPNKKNYPRNTKEFGEDALDTEFVNVEGESKIELEIPKNEGLGISFAFHDLNNGKWYNNYKKDFQIKFNH